MSSSFEERRRWIFVSHASADLKRVRQIRNYLEEKGGSPLLFHLLALSKVDEFWPIIEREIAARNFFLYCESVAAGKSEWVQKEREVVQRIEKPKPRIGSIQVDGPSLDYEVLDKFLMATKVFATYSHNDAERAAPFLEELDRFGYQLTLNRKVMPVEAMSSAGNWELEGAILEAAREVFCRFVSFSPCCGEPMGAVGSPIRGRSRRSLRAGPPGEDFSGSNLGIAAGDELPVVRCDR